MKLSLLRSSHPEVLPKKDALQTCSKPTGEQQCKSAISTKLFCNFIEITPTHGCTPEKFAALPRLRSSRRTPLGDYFYMSKEF